MANFGTIIHLLKILNKPLTAPHYNILNGNFTTVMEGTFIIENNTFGCVSFSNYVNMSSFFATNHDYF
jgi:hypothetical protein